MSGLPPVALRVADRIRKVVWRVFGPRTVGVRGVVSDSDGRVLVVRHSYGAPTWHLPGGGVKRRESLVEALHRELREEAGVVVEGPVRLLGAYSNLREGKSDHIAVFVVGDWRRQTSDSSEIETIAWVTPAHLPDDISPGSRRRIEEWSRATGAIDFDW